MTKAKNSVSDLIIVQIRSGIGCEKSQSQSLKALGLGKIGKKVVRKDDGCVRGLVRKVSHLIKVEGTHE